MTPDETFTMLANARLATQLEQMRRERDEARAKLSLARLAIESRYEFSRTASETLAHVLRIIDEKEGGQ